MFRCALCSSTSMDRFLFRLLPSCVPKIHLRGSSTRTSLGSMLHFKSTTEMRPEELKNGSSKYCVRTQSGSLFTLTRTIQTVRTQPQWSCESTILTSLDGLVSHGVGFNRIVNPQRCGAFTATKEWRSKQLLEN